MVVGDEKTLGLLSWCFGILREPLEELAMVGGREVDDLRIHIFKSLYITL